MNTSIPTKPNILRRLAAAVYDGFLLFAVLFAATSIYGYIARIFQRASDVQFATGDVMHELEPMAQGWLYNSYLILIIILFYGIFWCKSGQTLGMQAWRIKAQQLDGRIMTPQQAIVRVVSGAISFAFFGIGMLWILVDKQQRSLYDRASGTEVIELPKTK